MVKVFLCETAGECFSQLHKIIEKESSCCVLFPNDHFYDLFTYHYPQMDVNFLFTPRKLLQVLSKEAISKSVVYIFKDYTEDIDPNLFFLDSTIGEDRNYFDGLGFLTENLKEVTINFDSCILYGFFPKNVLGVLIEKLEKIFKTIFFIKRDFKKNLLCSFSNIKSYHVENVTEEKLWIQKRLRKDIPFVNCSVTQFRQLFQKDCDVILNRWLAWQEACSLGSFLIYLRGVVQENELFEVYKKDLKEAYSQCLIEDFRVLKQYLIEHDKLWIKDFIYEEFPSCSNFCAYLQVLKNTPFASILTERDYELLSKCLKPCTAIQFFAYLRRIIKSNVGSLDKRMLKWEQAVYLPIKDCYLTCALDGIEAKNQLAWLFELEKGGAVIEVCASLKDEKGTVQKPLLEANIKETFFNKFSENKKVIENCFCLPPTCIKFSCKAWERFHLCPRRTWLDLVLKVDTCLVDNHCLKAKVLGEWVHDNLQFKSQPKTFKDWQENIKKNAALRWQKLNAHLGQLLPYIFVQWHERALTLSYTMAKACEDLWKDEWQLFSEYSLPKNAENKGRIDLLAVKANQAIIIDYKTTAHYSFSMQQIGRGYGLQLLLYGRQLQKRYENVILRVVDKNGNNLALNLSDITESVHGIELWMKKFIETGVYDALPEEKLETLPLAWMKNT